MFQRLTKFNFKFMINAGSAKFQRACQQWLLIVNIKQNCRNRYENNLELGEKGSYGTGKNDQRFYRFQTFCRNYGSNPNVCSEQKFRGKYLANINLLILIYFWDLFTLFLPFFFELHKKQTRNYTEKIFNELQQQLIKTVENNRNMEESRQEIISFSKIKNETLRSSIKVSKFEKPYPSQQKHLTNPKKNLDKNTKFKSVILKKRKIIKKPYIQSQYEQYSMAIQQKEQKSQMLKEFTNKSLNSFILKNMDPIKQFFEQPVEFHLLYRASDFGFCVNKFHQICDDQTDTLVLCKTKHGYIIGGYTPITWKDKFYQNQTYFKTDKTNSTFLFSVTNNQKYPLFKCSKNKAICCYKSWGPTFGGGYDLKISNQADDNYDSISYFPNNFQSDDNRNHQHLTGSKNNEFKLLEWEVYKVKKYSQKNDEYEDKINQVDSQPNRGLKFLNKLRKGVVKWFFSDEKPQQSVYQSECQKQSSYSD